MQARLSHGSKSLRRGPDDHAPLGLGRGGTCEVEEMKDQYFGDINDYRKYALLRTLCDRNTCLSVCWMLTPDGNGPDGKKIKYLDQPSRWRQFDPELFDSLRKAVPGNRRVAWAEESGILRSACFFSRLLSDRKDQREEYFKDFLCCSHQSELVFFDPDNGLEVPSRPYGRKDTSKYLYSVELKDTWKAGHSVLLYQHFRRKKGENRGTFIENVARDLAKISVAEVVSFRTPFVVFFLLTQPAHNRLSTRAADIERVWGKQIRVRFHPARGNQLEPLQ